MYENLNSDDYMNKLVELKEYPLILVDKFGNVYRKDQYKDPQSGKIFCKHNGKPKKLKPNLFYNRKGGYKHLRVVLCTYLMKHKLSINVSRLVALAWVPNPKPEEYNVVMHLDNNPLNNYYKNLKWGTQSINIQQAVREGRFRGNTGPRPNSYGELNPNSKYKDRLVKRLYRYHLRHPKIQIKQLCLKFNTKPTWTYKILKGSVAILKDYTPY